MHTTKTDTYEPLVHQRHHKNSELRTHEKHSNHIHRPNKSFRPSRLELYFQNTGQIQIRKQNGPKHSNAIHKHHDKNKSKRTYIETLPPDKRGTTRMPPLHDSIHTEGGHPHTEHTTKNRLIKGIKVNHRGTKVTAYADGTLLYQKTNIHAEPRRHSTKVRKSSKTKTKQRKVPRTMDRKKQLQNNRTARIELDGNEDTNPRPNLPQLRHR